MFFSVLFPLALPARRRWGALLSFHMKQEPWWCRHSSALALMRMRCCFVFRNVQLPSPSCVLLAWLHEQWLATHPWRDSPPLPSCLVTVLFYHMHVRFTKPLKAPPLQLLGLRDTLTQANTDITTCTHWSYLIWPLCWQTKPSLFIHDMSSYCQCGFVPLKKIKGAESMSRLPGKFWSCCLLDGCH